MKVMDVFEREYMSTLDTIGVYGKERKEYFSYETMKIFERLGVFAVGKSMMNEVEDIDLMEERSLLEKIDLTGDGAFCFYFLTDSGIKTLSERIKNKHKNSGKAEVISEECVKILDYYLQDIHDTLIALQKEKGADSMEYQKNIHTFCKLSVLYRRLTGEGWKENES